MKQENLIWEVFEMKSLLEELFYGNIHPVSDERIVEDREYQKAMDELVCAEEKLKKAFSKEQFELIFNYSEKYGAVQTIQSLFQFKMGFFIGSEIIAEFFLHHNKEG